MLSSLFDLLKTCIYIHNVHDKKIPLKCLLHVAGYIFAARKFAAFFKYAAFSVFYLMKNTFYFTIMIFPM